MLSYLLTVILRLPSSLKRRLWWKWYQYVAKLMGEIDWPFMNYGFAEFNSHTKVLDVSAPDEKDRLYIQLYDHLARNVDLRGLDVLEVGCGRGGGSSYIARYLRPRSVVGLDFSPKAIDLCKRCHVVPGLAFAQGDAESLPFRDRVFDAVVNVESSHCYGSVEHFFAEVFRVLRPHGYFLFADFRKKGDIVALSQQVRFIGSEVVKEKLISLNVLAALERDDERKRAIIRETVPWLLRVPARQFAGAKGTKMFNALRAGQIEYLSVVVRKNPD